MKTYATKHQPRQPGPVDRHLATVIAARRDVMRLTQRELGARLGVTPQQVQKYETGKTRLTIDRLVSMAQALDLPVRIIFGEELKLSG